MANHSITLVIPTISRPTLARTLWSVRRQRWTSDDRIILLGDGPQPAAEDLFRQFRFHGQYIEMPKTVPSDWGHTPRNAIFEKRIIKTTHCMALDDDDQMTENALQIVRSAIVQHPDRPHLFRQNGCPITGQVWKVKEICLGNVGTPMFVHPNVPEKIARYTPVYGGDYEFIRDTCAFYPDGPVWHEDVITRIRPVKSV